jgi:predicted RNA-binding protein with PIN domain
MSEPLEIEHRDLRAAIEFAVLVAEEANKGKRSLPFPKELRTQFGVARIPTGALGRLRRVIEADETFRERIAVGSVPELVDPIGILWLQRPTGWEDQIRAVLATRTAEEHDADLRIALKRAEKRRVGAEQVAIRSQATIIEQQATLDSLRGELDVLRADLAKADDAAGELRSELVDVRNEARHAGDREAALRTKLEAARQVGGTTPAVPAPPLPGVDVADLDEISLAARAIGDRIDALVASLGPSATSSSVQADRVTEHRRPLRLPGGVIASSRSAAEFLLRTDAAVVVDGYNVAKLGWPADRLDEQRRRLLDGLENLARRYGTDVTVIFDGSTVVGAHADRRRMVRVAYSPEGVIADDVIRDEVRRLPAKRPVVVVTNDAEIVRDVRALGANVVPSNALLAVL